MIRLTIKFQKCAAPSLAEPMKVFLQEIQHSFVDAFSSVFCDKN